MNDEGFVFWIVLLVIEFVALIFVDFYYGGVWDKIALPILAIIITLVVGSVRIIALKNNKPS